MQEQIDKLAAAKQTQQTHPAQKNVLVSAEKLKKNRRLPATMITPSGGIETSKKKGAKQVRGKGKRKSSDQAKEKALERMEKLETKVRARDEKQVRTSVLVGGDGFWE